MNAVTFPERPGRAPSSAKAPIVYGLSVDVEDWFQVGAFESVIERDDWSGLADRVERNVGEIPRPAVPRFKPLPWASLVEIPVTTAMFAGKRLAAGGGGSFRVLLPLANHIGPAIARGPG